VERGARSNATEGWSLSDGSIPPTTKLTTHLPLFASRPHPLRSWQHRCQADGCNYSCKDKRTLKSHVAMHEAMGEVPHPK